MGIIRWWNCSFTGSSITCHQKKLHERHLRSVTCASITGGTLTELPLYCAVCMYVGHRASEERHAGGSHREGITNTSLPRRDRASSKRSLHPAMFFILNSILRVLAFMQCPGEEAGSSFAFFSQKALRLRSK